MLVRLVFIRYNIDQTKAKVTLIDVIAVDDKSKVCFLLIFVYYRCALKGKRRKLTLKIQIDIVRIDYLIDQSVKCRSVKCELGHLTSPNLSDLL